jgi:glycosyltransferase involved in cell wall biosynthesis
MPPTLTVITPSLNHARFLRRCIDSVLDQGYPRLEYLVLDGGSTDGTREILESYGDRFAWRSRPDRGQAAAINEGFASTRGEIVAWLNSDDYYLPGAFNSAVAFLDAHPDADMVYGRAHMVDESGRRIREYPTFAFSRRDLSRKCYVCQPTVFIRRRALDAFGPLDERLDICFDYEWWLRVGRTGSLRFCDEVLAASRHHTATKTAGRRLRALVEAGYLMRRHYGRASWRWSAKWIARRWRLRPWRFVVPVVGWLSLIRCARRYHRRFDTATPPSAYGAGLLDEMRPVSEDPAMGPRSALQRPRRPAQNRYP